MSERKKRDPASSQRLATLAPLQPLLPAKILPKPPPITDTRPWSGHDTTYALPSRSSRDASAHWRPIQPRLGASNQSNSFIGAHAQQKYLHKGEDGKFRVWEVNKIGARRPVAPRSKQLLTPPTSEKAESNGDATSPVGERQDLASLNTECALCGTDVSFLVSADAPASSAYYCFPCHARQERLSQIRHNHQIIARRLTIPASPPTTKDATLSMKLARAVEAIGSQHSWISLGPSRCGANRAFDAAAQALYQGAMYRAQRDAGRINDDAQRSAVVNYSKAANLLVKTIDSTNDRLSDEILAIVLMFYTFEVLVPSPHNERTNFHHLSAIKTILLARRNDKPPSELTRALVYTIAGWLFYALAAIGFHGPSPFEHPYYLNMEPYSLDSPPPSLTTLRKITLQLYFKLPRLISHIHTLRAGTETPTTISTIVTLATTLLHLDNRPAENATVRLLTITRTTPDSGLSHLLPYSYSFGTLHWQAVVNYWQCRLIVLRLARVVSSLALRLFDLQWLDRAQEGLLVREQDRCCESVLMCWQFACGAGFTGRAQMIGVLNEVWGALAGRETMSQGYGAAEVRTFVLEQRRKLGLGVMGERGAREMDEAMRVFGGFPDSLRGVESGASKVWEVRDEEVFTDEVELDWFGFGKDEVQQKLGECDAREEREANS